MARNPVPETTIGERITARRLLRGLSVRYAATRAGMTHAAWSRIERGIQAADNRFVLADIAAALECAPVELTGVLLPTADRQAMAAHACVYAIREALVDADLAMPSTRSARPLPALGLEFSLARDLRHGCDYASAARLLPELIGDLHAAAGGAQRRLALRLLCDTAFLASSVLRSLGHPVEAWLAAERCHHFAEAAQEPLLLGYAAYARANAALAGGAYSRGLALGERGVDDIEPHVGIPGGLEMLGTLHLVCAEASRGLKRSDDSRTWMAHAVDIAGRTGETATLGLFFGPTNVNVWQIGIENDGGDPGRAVEISRATDPAVIGVKMREVFFYTDTARACARIFGKDAEAIRHLLTAERIAPQHVHSSPLVRETARELLERARRRAGGAALRGLCDRMSLAG